MGSTRVARRAGIRQAPSATTPSIAATRANVAGSDGFTSNSRLVSNREAASAPANPAARPARMGPKARAIVRPRMLWRCAPSARRSPISGVRCATAYEITPYTPTTASARATLANSSRRAAWKRRWATEAETTSSSVSTRVTDKDQPVTRLETALGDGGRDDFFERLHAGDRLVFVDGPHLALHVAHNGQRRACRADGEIRHVHRIEAGLRGREEDLRMRLLGLALEVYLAHHAGDRFPIARAGPADAVPDGIAVGE